MKNKLIKKKISIITESSSPFSIVKFPKKKVHKLTLNQTIPNQKSKTLKRSNSLKEKKRLNKYRKYDVDSMKKLLKKNLWNNLHKKVSEYAQISHVKSKEKDFKTKTLKKFEVKLLKNTIATIYKDYYDLDEDDFKKKMIENKQYPQVKFILDKTLEDYFKEYRNSLEFFSDAVTSSKGDFVKLKKYLKLGKCYLTYLQKEKHTNLENTKDDPDLTSEFYNNYEIYINNNNIIKSNDSLSTNEFLSLTRGNKLRQNDSNSVITMKDLSVSGIEPVQYSNNQTLEQQYQDKLNSLLTEMQSKLVNRPFEDILKNTVNKFLPQKINLSSDSNLFTLSLFSKNESKPSSFNSVRSVSQLYK